MSSISFDNPYLLFLAIPIAALFVIPYAIVIRKENLNGHNIASGVIHIIMALIIAFVAAGTTIVTTVTETNVYVVADVSYSASRNLSAIDGYISDLSKSLPKNSKLGVVTFGKNYQLLTPLGDKTQSVKNSLVDDSATDIISALKYTGTLFREDVIKRIVLITDGRQTGETDQNALKRQVDALAESKIHVDAIYLDDNLRDNAREVQLSSVQVNPTTFSGRDAYAKLNVNCSCPETTTESGKVEAYEVETIVTVKRRKQGSDEEPVVTEKTVGFTRGTNGYSLPLYTEEQGIYDYEVILQCSDNKEDENPHNNVLSFTQEVSGGLSVLVIYGNDVRDEQLIYDAYGDSAQIDSYYYGSSEIRCDLEWINKFDEIVLSNVDVTKIQNYDTFLLSLNTAVDTYGKSLITFGDTNIQNYSHGELKELSDMLPVTFGKANGENKLYTLVIDTSRSMEAMGRLSRAKTAAKEIVDMLGDGDTVSVVQFNGDPSDVEPKLVKLDDEGRKKIKAQIDALDVRQGTNIPAALQFAVPTATSGNYAERRLFLFSDGMNYDLSASSVKIENVVAMLRERGVATSTLDVGRDGYSNNDKARGERLLKNTIAVKGGGAYLDISTEGNLKEVLDKALPEDINESTGTTSAVYVKRRTEKMLENVDVTALQSDETFVEKFVYSKAKGPATTVLEVEFTTGTTANTTQVPLYAYWSCGKGSVASFTAGLSDEWLPDMSMLLRGQLIEGILGTNVPDEKLSEPFIVDVETTEGYATVTLTPEKMNLGAVTSVEVKYGNKTLSKSELTKNGSGYTHTFVTPDEGKYTVEISYKEGSSEFKIERAVHVAYSSEYDSFVLYDAAAVHKMIGVHGTVYNDSFKIVNDPDEVGLYNVSLNLPLLISCVALYAVDIAVRKLKWEDIKSLFKRHKKVKK